MKKKKAALFGFCFFFVGIVFRECFALYIIKIYHLSSNMKLIKYHIRKPKKKNLQWEHNQIELKYYRYKFLIHEYCMKWTIKWLLWFFLCSFCHEFVEFVSIKVPNGELRLKPKLRAPFFLLFIVRADCFVSQPLCQFMSRVVGHCHCFCRIPKTKRNMNTQT